MISLSLIVWMDFILNITFFNSKDERFRCVKSIRTAVFTDEQGLIADEEFDAYDQDDNTLFALVYNAGEPVATGRIVSIPDGVKIGRIAVLSTQRGKGTGKFLVESLCNKVQEMCSGAIYVDSQLHAQGFYENLGFVPTGEPPIFDRGISHLPMKKG